MTAIGVALLVLALIIFPILSACNWDNTAALVGALGIVGFLLVLAGVVTWLWRVMP